MRYDTQHFRGGPFTHFYNPIFSGRLSLVLKSLEAIKNRPVLVIKLGMFGKKSRSLLYNKFCFILHRLSLLLRRMNTLYCHVN